ncbi:MAG: hypothetical protein VB124_02430 [Burkholderia sp.]
MSGFVHTSRGALHYAAVSAPTRLAPNQRGIVPNTLKQRVKHLVVVIFENRSLGTMLGWLYPDGEPLLTVRPPGS